VPSGSGKLLSPEWKEKSPKHVPQNIEVRTSLYQSRYTLGTPVSSKDWESPTSGDKLYGNAPGMVRSTSGYKDVSPESTLGELFFMESPLKTHLNFNEVRKSGIGLNERPATPTKEINSGEDLRDSIRKTNEILERVEMRLKKNKNPFFHSTHSNATLGLQGLGLSPPSGSPCTPSEAPSFGVSICPKSEENKEDRPGYSSNVSSNLNMGIDPQPKSKPPSLKPPLISGAKGTKPNLFENIEPTRRQEKTQNPMFRSAGGTGLGLKAIRGTVNVIGDLRDIEQLMLPKQVNSFLSQETANVSFLEEHLRQEKAKIEEELDNSLEEIKKIFQEAKAHLLSKFDDYLACYKANYGLLKDKIKEFKDSKSLLNGQSADLRRQIKLEAINFYAKDLSGKGQFIKYKEEKYKLKANLKNIQREVDKKLLLFFADELSKQTQHFPEINQSEMSQQIVWETRNNITNFLKDQLENYDRLIYYHPSVELGSIYAVPSVHPSISKDRTMVLGGPKTFEDFKPEFIRKLYSSHNVKIRWPILTFISSQSSLNYLFFIFLFFYLFSFKTITNFNELVPRIFLKYLLVILTFKKKKISLNPKILSINFYAQFHRV
jgi:hypothetical protein